jgi:mannose-6-phosphate isomerase-like protein (cupin superfamily)
MSTPATIPADALVRQGTLPETEDAAIFTGADHGNVPVSLFLVHSHPGSGPRLHRHPYPEVFVIHAGQARFRLGESEVPAAAGDVVIAPAGVAHSFTATGQAELRLTAIHTSPEFETEWLEQA